MKVVNRLKVFADSRGLTAYALWKATRLTEPTVYRLYNHPDLIPSGKVLTGLYQAFPDTTPNDWLEFVSNSRKK
jgi:Cro/C1-type HTH DNA-binding domain